MMKKSFYFSILCLISSTVFAMEPQNPLGLCERFIDGPQRSECEKKMTNEKPDWYLATICNESFDDQMFYDCVSLSKLGSYSPTKLDECHGDQLNDAARITCVKAAKTDKAFQSTKLIGNKKPKAADSKKH